MRRGILADKNELRNLRDRIHTSPFNRFYDILRNRCSLILEASPITETQWQHLWQHGHWYSALTAVRTAQGRILDLIICHHSDNNPAYRDRAIEELVNLVGWSTWVDPCHSPLAVDLCTAGRAPPLQSPWTGCGRI